MNAKHNRVIGSLIVGTVIASVLASIGCADGQRHGGNSGKGRRMFRTQGNPTSAAPKGALNKDGSIASAPVTNDANGSPTFDTNSEGTAAEKTIGERVAKMKDDAGRGAALVAGEYVLSDSYSHVAISKNNVWAHALASTLHEGEAKTELLASGTYDGTPIARELKLANAITVVGGKITIAAGREIVLKSSVERNKTKIAIVESNPPVAAASAGVPSIVDLLSAGKLTVDGKVIGAVASTIQDGMIMVWITVDEKVPGKADTSGDSFVRNFFFVFAPAAATGTDGAKGADGTTDGQPAPAAR